MSAAELAGVQTGVAGATATVAGAPATPALIAFRGVQKTYDGEVLVVKSLDLDIRRGEFLTMLGPSGSGKTTSLMMLAGFESPTAGEILLNGQPITHTPPHKRNFGMVFQNYALFPHLSVAQNVAYPLTVRRVARDEQARRVARALDMVQLRGKDDRLPGQLSGGQQQRVALARALVFDPQLVLMDEPLGALDKQLREHMQLELKAMHQRLGLTFVYVTHDQGEALTMSDRVAVFDDGIVQQLDVVDRLYEAPNNRFVAGFIGDTSSFDGSLAQDAGANASVALPGGPTLRGLNVNRCPAGSAVRASIRPERIRLHAHDPGADRNALGATVASVIYYGDHLRVLCEVPGQAQAIVKLPLDAPPPPAPGHPVWLELPPDHLRIYR